MATHYGTITAAEAAAGNYSNAGMNLIRVPSAADRIRGAVRVFQIEARALRNLEDLYEGDVISRDGFGLAVDAIVTRHRDRNSKVIFAGVGESGLVGRQLAATFAGFGIPAVFLQPTDALHGDLGNVNDGDTMVMVSFSGKSPELQVLLPHISAHCPVICLTGATDPGSCPIAKSRPNGGATILLPASNRQPEAANFRVAVPTASTAVAIAVGHALAFVASHEMFASVPAECGKNHGGEDICAEVRILGSQTATTRLGPRLYPWSQNLAVSWREE